MAETGGERGRERERRGGGGRERGGGGERERIMTNVSYNYNSLQR